MNPIVNVAAQAEKFIAPGSIIRGNPKIAGIAPLVQVGKLSARGGPPRESTSQHRVNPPSIMPGSGSGSSDALGMTLLGGA